MQATSKMPIGSLKKQLGDSLQRARTLPPWTYTDPRFLALEHEKIFSSCWLCVGRAAALSDPGDYLVTKIGAEPLIIVRSRSGELRAMSNVCRHRMSELLEGRGNVRRIVCPYHAWTYDLDGALIGAPEMQQNETFCRQSIRLPEVRCEVWLGWIFVTLDPEAPPPSRTYAELAARISDYQMQNYVESFRKELRWHANWKLVAENFMESYHLPVCHSGTVGPRVKLRDLDKTIVEEGYNYHCIVRESDNKLTSAHASNTRLSGSLRHTTWVLALYPSLMVTLTPGYFWYLAFAPEGTDNVNITFGGGMAPEFAEDESAQAEFSETLALTSAIVEEDNVCVERVFRGLQASLADPGPLSHLEGGNFDFATWVVDRVTS